MKDYKIWSIVVVLIMVIFCIIAIINLEEGQKNLLNYISVIGFPLSILGLILTYFQILSIKESNKMVEVSITKSIGRINQILSVSDLSKSIKNIDETQNYIKNTEYKLALLRMKDIKIATISLKFIEELKDLTSKKDYSTVLFDFNIDLNNINSYIQDETKKPDFIKIINNLEKLSTKLSELENHLKNSKL